MVDGGGAAAPPDGSVFMTQPPLHHRPAPPPPTKGEGPSATPPHRDGAIGNELNSTKLLSYVEWKEFTKDLQLYDSDFTAREVSLPFAWCRMRVVDEELLESKIKAIQLSFEDFLEAIVRISTIKALPNDEQIYDNEAEDVRCHRSAHRWAGP